MYGGYDATGNVRRLPPLAALPTKPVTGCYAFVLYQLTLTISCLFLSN